MSTPALTYFLALVRFETDLWNLVEKRISAAPLTLGRYLVLTAVEAVPECRVQDIANSVGSTVGAVSRLIDRLEGDGLVARIPHPKDRRSSLIRLEPRAVLAVETTKPILEQAIADALATIESTELAATAARLTEHHRAVRSRA